MHRMEVVLNNCSFEYDRVISFKCIPAAALKYTWPEYIGTFLCFPDMIGVHEWSVRGKLGIYP